MELTPEERRLAEKLFNKIQRQRREDRKNEHYYRGMQEIGNLGIAVPPDVQPFAFPLNWCRTYIEANDLDSLSHLVHRDLLIYGRAFISVAARDGGGRPRIMPESPKDIAALVDARTREMTAALRIYRDDTGIAEYMTLYLPDSTVLIDRRAGKWEATRRIKHRLGRVPLVMILNRQRTGEWSGETQLADLRPLVDMAGRVMLQLQLAMETVATPQKVALGVSQKDFVDADGNQIEDPWETYLGAIWAISSKDAKIEQLSGAQLTGFHDTIKMLAEQAATVTGLPVRMMGQNTANPAAEGAIRADESRLVKQVERLNTLMGAGWAWALGIAERIRTGSWDADGQISTLWQNPGTPTESQRADALQKSTGGRPFMSERGAMAEMGWPQQRIDRELEWLEQENSMGGIIEKLERGADDNSGEREPP